VRSGRQSIKVRTGFLLLVATGLIWGTIGVAGRLIFDRTDLDALEVSWLRTMFAAPTCFLIGLRLLGRRLFQVAPRDLAAMAALSATIYAFQFLYLIGVDRIGVSMATLVCLCSIPVMVAIASAALFGERPGRAVVIALLGAVGGTALLTIGQGGSAGSGGLGIGIAASLLSAVGATIYALGSRAIVQRYHPITMLALGFPITLVIFAPVMRGGHVTSDIPISAWLLLIYLGVGTQGIAYLFYQWGLKTESATVASIVTLLEPVLAAILAWILFGERLGALGFAGAALLIAGLMLLSFGPRATVDAREAPAD
jgi:DME family drug/metabolite transporter